MIQLFYLMVSIVCFSAGLATFVFFLLRHEQVVMKRRSDAVVNPYLKALDERSQPTHRMLVDLSTVVHSIRQRLGMGEDSKLEKRLSAAGFYDKQAADIYVGIRLLVPLALVAVTTLFTTTPVVLLGVAGAGYLIPDFIVDKVTKKRQDKIRKSLPDTTDLLVICMDAGLGIDQAVQRTAEVLYIAYPELCDELVHLGRLQRMGQTRTQAWKTLVARTKSPDIEQVSNMLNQAETFGTPISESMRALADSLRMQRKQHAEEYAARSGIILLVPLVLFIFPVIFVVLLGPSVISIIRGFSSLAQ